MTVEKSWISRIAEQAFKDESHLVKLHRIADLHPHLIPEIVETLGRNGSDCAFDFIYVIAAENPEYVPLAFDVYCKHGGTAGLYKMVDLVTQNREHMPVMLEKLKARKENFVIDEIYQAAIVNPAYAVSCIDTFGEMGTEEAIKAIVSLGLFYSEHASYALDKALKVSKAFAEDEAAYIRIGNCIRNLQVWINAKSGLVNVPNI